MHTIPYHVPIIIKKCSTMKQFTGQGVEKNNDDAKKVFFQKSNKWDAARMFFSWNRDSLHYRAMKEEVRKEE